ncbi:glucose-6-phosphate dehydrogenase [Ramicandelaber brevisporus]|nr:glucose-6-phosphate dehydrogenase [Ramicandelaber brevisporus]
MSQHELAAKQSRPPTTIVVLGASGDLAKKKTYPALFGLFRHGLIPPATVIVGYARTKMTREDFHKRISERLKPDAGTSQLADFLELCHYVSGGYDTDDGYQELARVVEKLEDATGRCSPELEAAAAALKVSALPRCDAQHLGDRIFYLALPPSVFVEVASGLKKHLYSERKNNRLVVEKPFGMDSDSSAELGKSLGALYKESEIFRIDHYLGKDMVKNLLVLRFANRFFEPVWNNSHISNVQITFKEPFGTEGRGGYFDTFGIVRDVMQNHLMQMLSIMAMEPPKSLNEESIRDAKVAVLKSISEIQPKDVVLGQYIAADGKPGYKDDSTVDPSSQTPTYAVMVLFINNERWAGVPFIMKAGKALDNQKAEVRIQFKDVDSASAVFGKNTGQSITRNELVIRVGPTEAIYLKITNKLPGLARNEVADAVSDDLEAYLSGNSPTPPSPSTPTISSSVDKPRPPALNTVVTELDLTYKRRFKGQVIPDAYESLLYDLLRGDHANFVRDDELEEAWRIFTPILHKIDGQTEVDPSTKEQLTVHPYKYGSRGPQAGDDLIAKMGFIHDKGAYEWSHELAEPASK